MSSRVVFLVTLSSILGFGFSENFSAKADHLLEKVEFQAVYDQYIDQTYGTSLVQLLDQALRQSPQLKQAQAEVQAAQGRVQQSKLWPNPMLEIEYGEDRSAPQHPEADWSFTLKQPLNLTGQRQSLQNLAFLDMQKSQQAAALAQQQLHGELRQSFWKAFAVLEKLKLLEQTLADHEKLRKIVQARYREGETARFDVNLAHLEIHQLILQKQQLELDVKTQLLALQTQAGLSPQSEFQLKAVWPPQSANEKKELPQLQALALAQRLDWHQAKQSEKIVQAQLELAQAEAWPEIELFGQIQKDHRMAFGVSLPLPIFQRNQGRQNEARAFQRFALAQLQALEHSIRQEVFEAWNRVQHLQKMLEVHEQEILPYARQNQQMLFEAYQLGERSLFDVLTGQLRWMEAQTQHIEVLYESTLAQVALDLAIGLPLSQDFQNVD